MNVEDVLRNSGYKVTSPRKKVLSWIGVQGGIFSAREIMASLPDLDKVSVYRTLDMLESIDFIHSTLIHHGEKHYEIHGESHHHHVVCTECELASCVDCEVTRTEAKGFTKLHHSVVFTGLCLTCLPA